MNATQRKCFADHVKGGPNHVILATLIRADGDTQVHAVFSTVELAKAWISSIGGPSDEYRFNLGVIDIPEYGHLERTDVH